MDGVLFWRLAGQINYISIARASREIIKSFKCEVSWLPFPAFSLVSWKQKLCTLSRVLLQTHLTTPQPP